MLFLNESPYASHLWFLGSMVFAIGIMMLLNKCKLADKVIYAFPLLLGLYFFSWRLDGNMNHLLQYRNAIACTLAYFMGGCVLRKHEGWLRKHLKPTTAIVICSLLFASVAVEYIFCKNTAIPYYSAELLTFAIALLCIVCQKEDAAEQAQVAITKEHSWSIYALGRNCSLNIYILHIAVIGILVTLLGGNNHILNNAGPIIIFVTTLLFAYLIDVVKKILVSKKC